MNFDHGMKVRFQRDKDLKGDGLFVEPVYVQNRVSVNEISSLKEGKLEWRKMVKCKYVRSGCTTALDVVPWETDGESVLRESCSTRASMTNTQTPPTVVNTTGAPVTNAVANHAEKPEKFNGQNFKRLQSSFSATDLGSNEVETVVVEEDFVRKDEAQGSPFVDLSIVSANNQISAANMVNAGTSEVVKDDAQGMKFCCPQAHATHDVVLNYANVDIDDPDVRDRACIYWKLLLTAMSCQSIPVVVEDEREKWQLESYNEFNDWRNGT
ncbi:hypothetical protein Tco_1048743 [Tanacetum coccineum]